MKYVFTSHPQQDELLDNFRNRFRAYSDTELIEAYNRECRIGITGVRAQAMYLMALHQESHNRFGESPVHVKDGYIDVAVSQNM